MKKIQALVVKTLKEEHGFLYSHVCKCGGRYEYLSQKLLTLEGMEERGIAIPDNLNGLEIFIDIFPDVLRGRCNNCGSMIDCYYLLIKGEEFWKEREELLRKV